MGRGPSCRARGLGQGAPVVDDFKVGFRILAVRCHGKKASLRRSFSSSEPGQPSEPCAVKRCCPSVGQAYHGRTNGGGKQARDARKATAPLIPKALGREGAGARASRRPLRLSSRAPYAKGPGAREFQSHQREGPRCSCQCSFRFLQGPARSLLRGVLAPPPRAEDPRPRYRA